MIFGRKFPTLKCPILLAKVRDVSELRRLIEAGKKALLQTDPEMAEDKAMAEKPKWWDAAIAAAMTATMNATLGSLVSRMDAFEEGQRKKAERKAAKHKETKLKEAKRRDSIEDSNSGDNEDDNEDNLNKFFNDEINLFELEGEEMAKQHQKERHRLEKEWRKQQEEEA